MLTDLSFPAARKPRLTCRRDTAPPPSRATQDRAPNLQAQPRTAPSTFTRNPGQWDRPTTPAHIPSAPCTILTTERIRPSTKFRKPEGNPCERTVRTVSLSDQPIPTR
ncbi:hypothetical protein GCM10029964_029500 [Kibdelosporangium lantanae]